MRTGGAGLFQSADPSQAAAHSGPAGSIGPAGCSMTFGWSSGMTICCAAARKARLTNIAGAVGVDDASSRRGGRIDRQPADHLSDLVGAGDPAERDVGDDFRAAAAFQIF